MFDANAEELQPPLGAEQAEQAFPPPSWQSSVLSGWAHVAKANSPVASEPRKDDISEEAIRDELSRILESPLFVQSDRLGSFLRFTVETTLSGKAETLKEYLIGTLVYGRRPSYHPSEDSIVRSEARRLRSKLKQYYESDGQADPVLIYYRPGSYVPAFVRRRNQDGTLPAREAAAGERVSGGRGIRLAVVPFVDASRSAMSGACAQLITDDLIHALVRTDGLSVSAASSVAPLLAHAPDIQSLGRTLDVQIIFEGTVRQDGNRLRITVSVVNAGDGFQIWSERFETEADPLGLATVSERMVSALVSRVRPEQSFIRQQTASAGPSLLAAYHLVLVAEALLDEGSVAGTQAALSKFQEATRLTPDYARAVCGIALCYCKMALGGLPNSAAAIASAKEAAQRAAELDPHMMLVHASMGSVLALSWNWREAEKSFQQALGLGEHAGTYRRYGLVLTALGRFDEAWEKLHRAQQIDPFSNRQKVAYARLCYLSRSYDKQATYMSEELVYGPSTIESDTYRALMLISLDRREEAQQLARSLLRTAGAEPVMMSAVAEILAMCGLTAIASRVASEYNLISPHAPISRFRQALLSLALGNPDHAMSLLSIACEEHEAELVWLARDPRLDPIREDPRFAVLLNAVMADQMKPS
jgi:TolB-like protein/tetratricopeptide (TPR) repeat protein